MSTREALAWQALFAFLLVVLLAVTFHVIVNTPLPTTYQLDDPSTN